MKRVLLGKRYEGERVLVWMPRERRVRSDSSIGPSVLALGPTSIDNIQGPSRSCESLM